LLKKGTFSVKAERSKWDRSVVTTRLFVAKGKKQSRTRVSTISAGRFVVDGKHVSLKVKRSITTSNLLIKRESKNTVVIQTKKKETLSRLHLIQERTSKEKEDGIKVNS